MGIKRSLRSGVFLKPNPELFVGWGREERDERGTEFTFISEVAVLDYYSKNDTIIPFRFLISDIKNIIKSRLWI